jgi:outer membrane protein OmpA-like peptidoglycan-associated protein
MKFLLFLIFTGLTPILFYAQDYPFSTSIADCDGAAMIPQKGKINVTFPGNPGIYLDLNSYSLKIEEQNSIWLKFTAELDGFLNLAIDKMDNSTEVIFFKSNDEKICDQLSNSKINIAFDTVVGSEKLSFQKNSINSSFLNLDRGESVWIYFNNSNKKYTENISGSVDFNPKSKLEADNLNTNKVDLTRDKQAPTFELTFRSSKDKSPIIAEVVVKNSKYFDALYYASAMTFSLERTLKFDLKVDAVGYFPKDTSFQITTLDNTASTIYLDPVLTGSQMKLEGIEFFPESKNLKPEAKLKLKRIRDFLALNANLNIEVQGHVNQQGRNTFRAKRLSKKRAKAVRNYLISSGIEKSRVEFKGYGNEFMVYPEAASPEEKQANRRVEIKILNQ